MSVGRLVVSAFDVHLWTRSLGKDSLRPEAAFLADAAAYRAVREAGKETTLSRLVAFPLTREVMLLPKHGNHFWPRYSDAAFADDNVDASVPGPRDFLIPLRCRPKTLDLKFRSPGLDTPVTASATIWLWPFGWSSTIEFGVRGPLDFDSIRAIHEALRSPTPLLLNGKPDSLSSVFKLLGGMVREDIALPGKAPSDLVGVSRQIVLSAWLAKGEPARRYESDGTDTPSWADSEVARMHGAVLAKQMDVDDLKALHPKDGPRQYILTSLGATDFAITHFEKGTLIVLRNWSDASRKRERNPCLTSNIRTFSMVANTLIALIARRKHAGAAPAKTGIAVDARALLDQLGQFYRNPICAQFLAGHNSLKQVAKAGKPSPAVEGGGLREEAQ